MKENRLVDDSSASSKSPYANGINSTDRSSQCTISGINMIVNSNTIMRPDNSRFDTTVARSIYQQVEPGNDNNDQDGNDNRYTCTMSDAPRQPLHIQQEQQPTQRRNVDINAVANLSNTFSTVAVMSDRLHHTQGVVVTVSTNNLPLTDGVSTTTSVQQLHNRPSQSPLITGSNSDCTNVPTEDVNKIAISDTKKRKNETFHSTHHPNQTSQSPIKKSKSSPSHINTDNDNNNNTNTADDTSASAGRWTPMEHQAFLLGMAVHGREWKKVAEKIPSRTSAQVRSHAQKYFAKVERQQQLSASPTSNLRDGTVATASSDDFYQYDIDLMLATNLPRGLVVTPVLATGNDPDTRRESQRQTINSKSTNRIQMQPPAVQHLSETAQQEAARIISSPTTVEAEVQDTLQRLHERYRQLQQQLQRRQQARLLEQQSALQHRAQVAAPHQQPQVDELAIIESEPQQQRNEESPTHIHDSQKDNQAIPKRNDSDLLTRQRQKENDGQSLYDNHNHPGYHRSLSSISSSALIKDTGATNDNFSNFSNNINSEGGPKVDFTISKSAYNELEQKTKDNTSSSTCCSMSTLSKHDSTSSLLLLAESVVQVQAEEEIIALNVLRNGLYQHLLQDKEQEHEQRPIEKDQPTANSQQQITIEFADNIALNDSRNNDCSSIVVRGNASIHINAASERNEGCDQSSKGKKNGDVSE